MQHELSTRWGILTVYDSGARSNINTGESQSPLIKGGGAELVLSFDTALALLEPTQEPRSRKVEGHSEAGGFIKLF